MVCRAFVFSSRPGDVYRVGRSLRSLRAAGIDAEACGPLGPTRWREILDTSESVLLVRAGAWLSNPGPLQLPESSSRGRIPCALGCLRIPPEADGSQADAVERWRRLFSGTGGDFGRYRGPTHDLPEWVSLYLAPGAASKLRDLERPDLPSILALGETCLRVVHYPPLDVYDDLLLRVYQVITSLHRGGAERLTLDLLEVLPELGVPVRLATFGCASRSTFPTPLDTLELGPLSGSFQDRVTRLEKHALRFGADLLHAHLLAREPLQALHATGIPVLTTLHNSRPGWPSGLAELGAREVAVVAACSQAVEREARGIPVAPPLRTAWNGIRTDLFRRTQARVLAGQRLRAFWEFPSQAVVLLSLANFRPQKGLDRLPGILEACRRLFAAPDAGARPVHLVLAGEPALAGADSSQGLEAELRASLAREEAEGRVLWAGSVVEVTALLAAADVLVSPAAFEGLSLSHLEALSMGCPVVATSVGGAPEVAHHHPGLLLVPPEATADTFAAAIVRAVRSTAESPPPTVVSRPSPDFDPVAGEPPADPGDPRLESFSTLRMAERYRWLYRRALVRHAASRPRPGQGLWLITNHLFTGGAQSSARRLLLALHARAVPVRAALVQESPDVPSPGRLALEQAGIPITASHHPGAGDALRAAERLLESIDADPPAAVFFWNLIPVYKVLFADALEGVPVFDVSPGEMLFDSLDRYFRKPQPGLPYLTPSDYGRRLAGCVVKYAAEAVRAASVLEAPVHVIPNGIPCAEYSLASLHDSLVEKPALTLGTVSRLNPQKRLEDLFDALRIARDRLPPWRLRIAGGPESGFESYSTRLMEAAHDLPVEWLGDLPDVRDELRRWDLFVMISEPSGCPNAILEAMATGLPVVATAVGGACEQIRHAESGWLVPPRDAQALADALIIPASDAALRRRVGLAARQRIEREFGIDRMAEAYAGLLRTPSPTPADPRVHDVSPPPSLVGTPPATDEPV